MSYRKLDRALGNVGGLDRTIEKGRSMAIKMGDEVVQEADLHRENMHRHEYQNRHSGTYGSKPYAENKKDSSLEVTFNPDNSDLENNGYELNTSHDLGL